MANKKNRKRENRKEKREERGNKKEEGFSKKEGKKEKSQEKENVILMGAPETKKEIKGADLASKTQLPLEGVDTTHTKEEEKKPIAITNNVVSGAAPKSMNLGRVFLSIALLLLAYLILGNLFSWFGPLDIKFLSLWPLLLIFVGLLLFRVRTFSGKILGTMVVFVVLFASLSVLIRGGEVFSIVVSEDTVVEEREVSDFHTVVFEGVGDVTISQGDEYELVLNANEEVLKHITSTVSEGVLKISHRSPLWNLFQFDGAKISAVIVSPEIEGLHIIGKGDIHGSDIKGENLEISISGSGDVDLTLVEYETVNSRVTGSGDITLSGIATMQVVSISGSGSYDGEEFSTEEAGVRISGSGDVALNVVNLLDVSITGSGDVEYAGSPILREGKVSGSGRISEKSSKQEESEDLDPKEFYEKVKPVF